MYYIHLKIYNVLIFYFYIYLCGFRAIEPSKVLKIEVHLIKLYQVVSAWIHLFLRDYVKCKGL